MADNSKKAGRKRWRWKLTGAVVFLLLAGAAVWHYVGSTWYTDGSGLRARASDASLREVLWTPPQPLAADAATPQQEYEPCLSADGRELFFVRGKAGHGTGADLFVSERRGQGWSDPSPLSAVNGPSDELGPSLSADGRILFFYSDRAGGLGQYDLWAAPRLADGSFGAPFNLGPAVNSPFNEYSPALSPDARRLFFASNRKAAAKSGSDGWRATIRQGDLGDYDLYSAELIAVSLPATRPTTNPSTRPQDIATITFHPAAEVPGVNTTSHEGACAISPHGDFLYFTSNRPGGHGGFDIYRVRLSASAVGNAAENLGPQVNTVDNEADPHPADGGFRIYFSSDRVDQQTYRLFTTDSREVFPVRVTPPLPRVSRSWLAFIIALAVLVPLLLYLQGAERGRFSLLQKCLVASLLLHLVLTMMISGVHVSNDIVAYVRDRAGDGDGIGAGFGSNTEAEVMLQVRSQMTDLSAPAAGPSALTRAEVASAAVPAAASPTPVNIELPRGQPLPAALSLEAVAPSRLDVVLPVQPPSLASNLPAMSAEGPEVAIRAPAAPALQAGPALQPAAQPGIAIERRAETGTGAIFAPTLGSRQAPAAQAGSATSLVQAPAPAANVATAGGAGSIDPPSARAEAASGTGITVAAAPRASGPVGASGPDTAVAPGTSIGSPALGPSQSGASGAGQLPRMPGHSGPTLAGAGSIAQGPGIEPGVVRSGPDAVVTPSVPVGGASGPASVIDAAPAKPAGPFASGGGDAAADGPRVAIANVKSEPQATGVPGGGGGQPSVNISVPGPAATVGSIASAAPLSAVTPNAGIPGGGPSTRPSDTPGTALAQAAAVPIEVASPKASAPRPASGDAGTSAPSVTAAAPRPVEAASVSSPGIGAGPASFEPQPLTPTATATGAGPLAIAPVAPQLPAGAPQSITILPRTGVGPSGGRPDGDLPEGLSQRSMEQRQPLLEKLGGTPESEAAVARALAYLARNQEPDGRWTMVVDERPPGQRGEDRHDPGLTSLAALAFLASDHTPGRKGPYRQTVHKAFEHLLIVQQRNGDCRGAGDMYDHALVTIAFAEAAIMTGDRRYRDAAIAGAEFITATIDRTTGGWRYKPFQAGDTSVVGWQVMALKSVQTLDPEGSAISPGVRQHALRFLSSVSSGRSRILAGYQPGREATPPMTAEATFARILLGQQLRDAQVSEFTSYVFDNAPGKYDDNFYYWYYTSLALLQLGGQSWKEWNPLVRDRLVELQHKDGRLAGSWEYDQSRHGIRNGRIYSTVMATLTLEVYYRYLPMYGKAEKAAGASNGR